MKQGYLYITLATIFFSTMEITLKLVSGEFNPIQLTFLRFFIGSIILLPLAIKNLKAKKLSLNKNDFKFFAMCGFICVVVSMTFFQLAILYGKASIVAILFSCNPIFVIPLAFFMLSEKIYKHTIASLVISLIGVVVIMNPANIAKNNPLSIILALLSAATFALYGVVSAKKSQRYGGIVSSCFSFLLGSIEMLALIFISKISFVSQFLSSKGLNDFASIPILKGITLSSIPSLIYIGVFVTGLGYTFYFLAIENTNAATASLVFYIKPALAPILALFVLRESLALNTVVGMLFIITSSCITFIFNSAVQREEQAIPIRIDEEDDDKISANDR